MYGLGQFSLPFVEAKKEDVNLQRKYVQQVPVSYPLLTLGGEAPVSTATLRAIQRFF